jgi:hypothetical protein
MSFTCEKPCECPVCFESLNEDKALSCGHWVHKNCIIRSKKDTCPLCRKQVELTLEEKDVLFKLTVQDIIQTQYIDDEEEEYFNENIYIQDEEEEDLPYTMPAENTIVTLYLNSMFRVEDEAILYDGRVISVVGNRFKVAFTNEFEAMNFCSCMEGTEEVERVNMNDLRRNTEHIQVRNEILIDA